MAAPLPLWGARVRHHTICDFAIKPHQMPSRPGAQAHQPLIAQSPVCLSSEHARIPNIVTSRAIHSPITTPCDTVPQQKQPGTCARSVICSILDNYGISGTNRRHITNRGNTSFSCHFFDFSRTIRNDFQISVFDVVLGLTLMVFKHCIR